MSGPARVVHLGLGAFARAHQAWYTHHAPDGADWPIAAFGGRSATVADALAAAGGRYTLVTRAPDGDRFETITSITSAHAAADVDAWLAHLADPAVAVVTATVTEAGWRADGPTSAPARLVAGLDARRRADAGPLAVVPCDNLPANGEVVTRVVTDLAASTDEELAAWIGEQVSFVSTVVDRITPRTIDADRAAVLRATGVDDASPVVTEPFSEWVLAGAFPGGRPAWDAVGARLVDDVDPFARRKLWLLNGAHSLLAYLGSIRGHATVDAAMADDVCAAAVARWWASAGGHLDQPGEELDAYTVALTERFANARMAHRLDQIAADGSAKVPVRILPVLAAEQGAGREPTAAATVVAAWICHLRGAGAPVDDAAASEVVPLADGPRPTAVRRVVGALTGGGAGDETGADVAGAGPAAGLAPRPGTHGPLADDAGLVALVADLVERLERTGEP